MRISLAEDEVVERTFESQEDVKEFIAVQGAAGLRNGDNKLVSKLMQVPTFVPLLFHPLDF